MLGRPTRPASPSPGSSTCRSPLPLETCPSSSPAPRLGGLGGWSPQIGVVVLVTPFGRRLTTEFTPTPTPPGQAFDDLIEAKGNAIGVIDMVLVALEWGLQKDGMADPMRCKMMSSMLKMTLTVHNKCEAEVSAPSDHGLEHSVA